MRAKHTSPSFVLSECILFLRWVSNPFMVSLQPIDLYLAKPTRHHGIVCCMPFHQRQKEHGKAEAGDRVSKHMARNDEDHNENGNKIRRY